MEGIPKLFEISSKKLFMEHRPRYVLLRETKILRSVKVQRFVGMENIVNSPRIEQRGNFVSVPARQIA